MFTPLVANPPSALYSAAGRLRTLKMKLVTTGPLPGGASTSSRESTTKRVVLCSSSSTSSARICRP